MLLRVETKPRIPIANRQLLRAEVQEYLDIPLEQVDILKVYRVRYQPDKHSRSDVQKTCRSLLCDAIIEDIHFTAWIESQQEKKAPSFAIDIQYKAGVTDNVARSAEEAFRLLGIDCQLATGTLYLLYGLRSIEEARRIALELLGNALLQDIQIYPWADFLQLDRFKRISFPVAQLEERKTLFQLFDTSVSLDIWKRWSIDNCWALSTPELLHLREYFSQAEIQQWRETNGLPKQPTDVELEIIAQSWSEHCKHKIFAADIDYQEGELDEKHIRLGDQKISSLFTTFILSATQEIEQERDIPWLRSVFHDNAGVVDFDRHLDIAIKVETHNSPSALDPYGGAITGILGVNRDILGVGMGARPIGNMNVFCLADPSWPLEGDALLMPTGLQQPRRLLEGVHRGVKDGGNTSGIPTINGAMFFDQDYAGKPLIFVGSVGVMPKKLTDGTSGVRKEIQPGDLIYMVGGAIGADGIHGATFSSLVLDDTAPATAVQIGDPITQKRVLNFLIEARDLGLFSCLTDNGAGGLSSSIGELAVLSNGAQIDLSRAPTKYPNLKPWELMISESQERMSVAVPPEKADAFAQLAKRRGVVATHIGEFNRSGNLLVYYAAEPVALLALDFLHESLPTMNLTACWDGSLERKSWIIRDNRIPEDTASLTEKLYTLLDSPNIASKELWVRQYDHEVQGATHIKPFGGTTQQGPNDAGVLWLYPHGGEPRSTICIGCGLQPRLSLYDPYLMAQYAVDEAIRNVVATGGDIDQTCLLDNFCWPDPILSQQTPDGDQKLGQLVRACKGLYDITKKYGTPIVSGKDSMKNDFRGQNGKGEQLTISVLPTLLVTALSRGSLQRSQSSSFKNAGDLIYWIGVKADGLRGSEYADFYFLSPAENQVPTIELNANLQLYRRIGQALEQGLLASVHDISDGGLLCALVESCFGERLGANIKLERLSNTLCFAEATGQFIVSVPPAQVETFLCLFEDIDCLYVGEVSASPRFVVNNSIDESLSDLLAAWTRRMT